MLASGREIERERESTECKRMRHMFHFHVELYSKIVKEDETKYLLSMINGELQMVDVMEENA